MGVTENKTCEFVLNSGCCLVWSCVKGLCVYVNSGANVWNETENKSSPVEHFINEDAQMTIVNFRCIFWSSY